MRKLFVTCTVVIPSTNSTISEVFPKTEEKIPETLIKVYIKMHHFEILIGQNKEI